MSQTYNLTLNKGDSYQLRANLTIQVPDFCVGSACSTVPLDLTDYVVKAVIKQSYDSCNVNAEFTITIDDPETGIVDLFLPASECDKLKAGKSYYWDLRVEKASEDKAFTAFKGSVTVSPTVTG